MASGSPFGMAKGPSHCGGKGEKTVDGKEKGEAVND
jgi:hypothetical protein